jgi:hypothetical protein
MRWDFIGRANFSEKLEMCLAILGWVRLGRKLLYCFHFDKL